jgi:serine/threonine-protein kinase
LATDLNERLQAALGEGYRIERELSGGGMSRVFVAEEVALERRVVVKILPPDLAAGLSVDRFRREIQLAAKLQHPHIVPLLTAGAKDGLLYYMMPLIEGESLRSRLARQHELPVGESIRLLRDVIDALSYAHANGVVHRDIKPDNVLVSGNHALVTDFGVSKALSTATGSSDITSHGVALGTPAYMSPEQAAADPNIDTRADIYSVGALGYELLTGRTPFAGLPPQQVLAAHISKTPEPVTQLRETVPPALEQFIMRALEKKPADRWQRADDMLAELEAIATPVSGSAPARSVANPWAARVAFATAILVLAGAVTWWMAGRQSPPPTVVSTTQITNMPGLELDPTISPNGQLVAYAAGPPGRMKIFVRQIAGGRTVPLSDSLAGDHRRPHWTPDGSLLSFQVGGALYTVPALGGSPRLLWDDAHSEYPSPTLSPDGRSLVYAAGNAVFVRAVENGQPRKIASTNAPPHSFAWSDDGRRIAFVVDNPWFTFGPTNIGNIAPSAIWVADVARGAAKALVDATTLNTSPVWLPGARAILFVSSATRTRDVYRQRVTSSGERQGAPERITTGLNAHTISITADGRGLVYAEMSGKANVWSAPLSLAAETPFTAAKPVTNENQVVEAVSASPDGKWIAYNSDRTGLEQIFKLPVSGGEPIQLTHDSTDHFSPVWSSDSRNIAFHAWTGSKRTLYVMTADGRERQTVTNAPGNQIMRDWSSDGQSLLFLSDRTGVYELYLVTRGTSGVWGEPKQVTNDGAWAGKISPDGSHVVYGTQTSPVVRLTSSQGGPSRVLLDGKSLAVTPLYEWWSDDSRFVICHIVDSTGLHALWAVPLSGGQARPLLRMDDPTRQPKRGEFSVRQGRAFFIIAADEADVWMMQFNGGLGK